MAIKPMGSDSDARDGGCERDLQALLEARWQFSHLSPLASGGNIRPRNFAAFSSPRRIAPKSIQLPGGPRQRKLRVRSSRCGTGQLTGKAGEQDCMGGASCREFDAEARIESVIRRGVWVEMA